ncbi:MAG: hypothetical protein HOO91_02245 [Bacteroidales bacterium]|nr:hypothetical protein [Bacteroidales bacterium]
MKLKVIAYSYLVPLFFLTLFALKITVPDFILVRFFKASFLGGFALGSLIVRLWVIRKYLISFTQNNNEISLIYVTSLGRQNQITLLYDSITEIKIKKRDWLITEFSKVTIVCQDNEYCFEIFKEKLIINFEVLIQKSN